MSRLVSPGRLWRTVRPLRRRQVVAWALHALVGFRGPRTRPGPAPTLRVHTVDVPFLPAPPHARLSPGHELELIHRRMPLDGPVSWVCDTESALFVYHLHQHDYLRDAAIAPRVRSEWMLDWIRRHRTGVGWDSHPVCLRTLAWGKLLVTQGALSLSDDEEDEIRRSMARQLDALSCNLEVRLQANHLLSNLIGLCFGAVLFEGAHADRWLRSGRALLPEIEDQVGADGLHFERSPMYHSLLLESVLDLIGLERAAPGRLDDTLRAALEGAVARMLGALEVVRHPDGEIALFADSAFGVAHPPAVLREYARSLGIEATRLARPGVLADAGYVRLSNDSFTLIASVGGPSPAFQPGHAHCDALAFELSFGDQRVVTDTGVYEYAPGERRDRARATRSHATLEVGGAEQAEIWAAHRVGGRPRVTLESVEPGRRAVASCASWSTPDTLHRRTFALRDDAVVIHDELVGQPRSVRLTLPLAPGLQPRLAHDIDGGSEAHVPLSDGRRLVIALPVAARWSIERTAYFPEFGRSEERACLTGRADDFQDGTWRFRVASR